MSNLIKRESDARVPQKYEPTPSPPRPSFERDDEVDVRRLFRALLKRKWQIALVTLLVVLPTGLLTWLSTPLYRSSVRLQIDPEAAQILPYKDFSEGTTSVSDFEMYLRTQFEVLQGPTLASRVIERLELEENPVFNQDTFGPMTPVKAVLQLLPLGDGSNTAGPAGLSESGLDEKVREPSGPEKRFLSMLEVRPIRSSRLVEVGFVSPDPVFSARVVDTVAEEFIKLHFERKHETTERATDFLEAQLATLRLRVEEAEDALIRYAREHNILHLDDRDRDVIRQRLESLNDKMTSVEGAYFSKRARFTALQSARPDNLPSNLKTPVIERLETRHFELRQKMANLTARFDENWPEVVEVRQEIAQVTEQLDQERNSTLSQALQQAELEFDTARQEYEMLSSALDEQKELTNRLNEASVQYNILRREVDTNEQLYQALLQRLKEAGVSTGVEFGNIHVMDQARVDRSVYRPRIALNVALALVLGLTLGVGLAFFREFLDDSLRTPEDLEQHLGLPALGMIPVMEKLKGVGRDRKRKRLPSITGSDQKSSGASVVPFTPSQWKFWESYRSLRTSILLSSGDRPPRTILFTSAVPQEGKTTTVAHMGVVLAQTGARTVMVDLDMRKPALGARFGLNGRQPGMSVYLSGNSDVVEGVQETQTPNLFILPTGPKPPNPAELLGSERMKAMLRELRAHFDYVLIDSPPVLTVADAQIIAPRVDGVVLVIKSGSTPTDVARKAGSSLKRVGARILGATINSVNLNDPEFATYKQYYYDESYYPQPD